MTSTPTSSDPAFFRPTGQGVLLHLRVTPNAGRDAVEGVETRDDGSSVMRVKVRAVPDRGRANQAVIALLAKALGLPRSALSVTSGETARLKTVLVAGDAPAIAARLQALAARK